MSAADLADRRAWSAAKRRHNAAGTGTPWAALTEAERVALRLAETEAGA